MAISDIDLYTKIVCEGTYGAEPNTASDIDVHER